MKIYPYLRLLWISLLINGLGTLGYLMTDHPTISLIVTISSPIAYVLMLVSLYHLGDESPRFSRAFICNLFAFALTIIAFLTLTLLPPKLIYFNMMLIMTASVFNLVGQYHLFWALDERVIPQGYVFPARRIRLGFYLPLIAAGIDALFQMYGDTVMPGMILQILVQLVVLVLLFQYLRAVRDREENPLSM